MAVIDAILTSAMLYLGFAYLLYISCRAIHRLFFSSIAHFPGPKLAAVSFWYEFYWDVVQPGRFTWHILDLHKQYGPIVRITPDELHILDSSYYDEFYARPKGIRHKMPRFSGRFGWRKESFSTWQHDLHKMRRTAIGPFFSAKRIASLQPLLRDKLSKFAQTLVRAYEIESIIPMNLGYMALAGDITTEYAFARSYDQIGAPGYSQTFDECLKALYVLGNTCLHFTWIHKVLDTIPRAVTKIVNPVVLPVVDFYSDSRRQINDIRTDINQDHKSRDNLTIFHELLNTDVLPEEEKTDERLGDEAVEIVAAGIITTSSAMTAGTFYILNNSLVLSKLVAELTEYFPAGLNLSNLDSDKSHLEWHALEALPYLSACVRESIRLSGGVVARSPRISPDQEIKYRSFVIPRGTSVSMTTWHISNDPEIFPDPEVFRPERWIIAKPDGTLARNTEMDRWIVAFGKGSRQCAGINLAFAELYLTLAVMFRSFTMELYETDRTDVEVKHAYLVPYPKFDSKGVRVQITGLNV